MRISKSTDINASTTDVLDPTVDNVIKLINDKKIIFKNDVAYWSRGKGVLPKVYRDCIYQTRYAHWINEWDCKQAEKFGDRAYYDYDGDMEVKASNMRISKSNKKTVVASIDSDINRYKKSLEKKAAKSGVYENFGADEIRKLRDKYSVYQDDVTDYRTAQHNLNSLNSFEDWCANYVGATTANDKALKHIKAAIDVLGKSGNKDSVTMDSIANLATVMFDIQSGADIKKK